MKFNLYRIPLLPALLLACLLIGASCSETHQLKTQQAEFEESLFLKYELVKYKLVKLTSMSRNPSIEGLNSRFRYANLPDSSYQGQIVIIDANKNDKFEYDSMDFVGLTSFDKKLRLEPISSIQSNRPVIVRIGGKNFEVTFDEQGEQITLTESSKEYDLAFPYQLPSKGAKALTEGAQLQATAGQYTYLQLWGSWCQPCLDQTPKIKALQNDFGQKLNIIGVNYKEENPEDAQNAISTNEMEWAQVQANEDLIKNLGSPGFVPCGILFDEQGQLVKYGVSPAEVKTLLSTNL